MAPDFPVRILAALVQVVAVDALDRQLQVAPVDALDRQLQVAPPVDALDRQLHHLQGSQFLIVMLFRIVRPETVSSYFMCSTL